MNYCLCTAHLGGPVHITLFAWLLLINVSLQCWPECSIPGSALAANRTRSIGSAKGIADFPLLYTTSLCSVVCQHPRQDLTVAQLLYNAGAGETVGGQDVDWPRL